ncbi:bucentaur or craniofacial development-domain-containing protein [Gilbertella persicaria]|uniref:bucentaur or craniofacial development-domain-containing protein n=1 Tax=Gilbertella persicaria TaxID=101096 RepID=UPI00221E3B2D|nr:bucentaur or craniofacial development-domain-containing protein [Gilbertella persicaria]KAI8063653.1 bucentaur or craniofacial development-domain-containing protein [Gilbertella persicaria]
MFFISYRDESESKQQEEEEKVLEKPKKSTPKRPKSNLSSLVSKYNIKEPKMNTLEKSKLDWQGFVDKEGIRDELKYKNKDGYMEKVAFLQRVDDRRLDQLKQGQKKKQ